MSKIVIWYCIIKYYANNENDLPELDLVGGVITKDSRIENDLSQLKLVREIIIKDSRIENDLFPIGSLRVWLEESSRAHRIYQFCPIYKQKITETEAKLLTETSGTWKGRIIELTDSSSSVKIVNQI